MSVVAYYALLLVISGYIHILLTPSNSIKLIHYDAAHLNMQATKCGLYSFAESALFVFCIDRHYGFSEYFREIIQFYGFCSFTLNGFCIADLSTIHIAMFSVSVVAFPFVNCALLCFCCYIRDKFFSSNGELSSDIFEGARDRVVRLNWALRERWRYQKKDPLEHLLFSSLILNKLLIFYFKDNKVLVGKVSAITDKTINKEHKATIFLTLTARGRIDDDTKNLEITDLYYADEKKSSAPIHVCFKLEEVLEISPYSNSKSPIKSKAHHGNPIGFIDTSKIANQDNK